MDSLGYNSHNPMILFLNIPVLPQELSDNTSYPNFNTWHLLGDASPKIVLIIIQWLKTCIPGATNRLLVHVSFAFIKYIHIFEAEDKLLGAEDVAQW